MYLCLYIWGSVWEEWYFKSCISTCGLQLVFHVQVFIEISEACSVGKHGPSFANSFPHHFSLIIRFSFLVQLSVLQLLCNLNSFRCFNSDWKWALIKHSHLLHFLLLMLTHKYALTQLTLFNVIFEPFYWHLKKNMLIRDAVWKYITTKLNKKIKRPFLSEDKKQGRQKEKSEWVCETCTKICRLQLSYSRLLFLLYLAENCSLDMRLWNTAADWSVSWNWLILP